MKAYCTSYKCDPKQSKAKGVHKMNILPGVITCPDCSHALAWFDDKPKPNVSMNNLKQRNKSLAGRYY